MAGGTTFAGLALAAAFGEGTSSSSLDDSDTGAGLEGAVFNLAGLGFSSELSLSLLSSEDSFPAFLFSWVALDFSSSELELELSLLSSEDCLALLVFLA